MDRRLSAGCEPVYQFRAKVGGKPVDGVICRDRIQWARLGRVGFFRAAYQPIGFLLGLWGPDVRLRLPPHPWVVIPLKSISNVTIEADDDSLRRTVVLSTAEQRFSLRLPVVNAQVIERMLTELRSGVQPVVWLPPTERPSPPEPEEPVVAPGWYRDPFGRYELRYWSGIAWTEDVSTHGSHRRDALG